MTHLELLRQWDTELELDAIEADMEHEKLRAEMVEKHGIEWVERVEAGAAPGPV